MEELFNVNELRDHLLFIVKKKDIRKDKKSEITKTKVPKILK